MATTLSGFVRVSVAAPGTEVDLALPAALPVAAVLPGLMERLGVDVRSGQTGHAGWTLRRLDGGELDGALDLSGNGVRDGDVLILQPAASPVRAPLFDDVVELFDRSTSEWSVRDSRALAAVIFGIALLLVTAAMVRAVGSVPTGNVVRLASLAGPVGLAALTALPTLALRLARVPPPAPDADDALGVIDVVARIAAARRLLTVLTACALGMSALACTVLAFAHSPWSRALAVVVATSILMRVRLYGARRFVVVVALAGASALLGTGAGLVFTTDPRWVVAGCGAVALGAAACIATAGRWRAIPRRRRLPNLIETLTSAAIVPVVLGVWQAYAAVPHLGR